MVSEIMVVSVYRGTVLRLVHLGQNMIHISHVIIVSKDHFVSTFIIMNNRAR